MITPVKNGNCIDLYVNYTMHIGSYMQGEFFPDKESEDHWYMDHKLERWLHGHWVNSGLHEVYDTSKEILEACAKSKI